MTHNDNTEIARLKDELAFVRHALALSIDALEKCNSEAGTFLDFYDWLDFDETVTYQNLLDWVHNNPDLPVIKNEKGK